MRKRPASRSNRAAKSGTIVNDGSDDVRSSNMSALGNTDLLSTLGLSDTSLEADLRSLSLRERSKMPRDAGSLRRIFPRCGWWGRVAQTCVDCGSVQQARLGSPLHLSADRRQQRESGSILCRSCRNNTTSPPVWQGPVKFESSLAQPLHVDISTVLNYSLSEAQVQFILGRMVDNGFDVSEVRLGMALAIDSTDHVGPIHDV